MLGSVSIAICSSNFFWTRLLLWGTERAAEGREVRRSGELPKKKKKETIRSKGKSEIKEVHFFHSTFLGEKLQYFMCSKVKKSPNFKKNMRDRDVQCWTLPRIKYLVVLPGLDEWQQSGEVK